MKTRSGIEMMTVGEIIDALAECGRDSVMHFNVEDTKQYYVLSKVEKLPEKEWLTWYDRGKGVVVFKDNEGKEVFRVEKPASGETAIQLEGGLSKEELRESLAEYSHTSWSNWIRYMFSKGSLTTTWDIYERRNVQTFHLPHEFVERWTRQMNTPYHQLSEEEKNPDRQEAGKMLEIVQSAQQPTD